MNSLVRFYNPVPSLFEEDDDFLGPTDVLMDRLLSKAFPQVSSIFGTNVFEASAYPKIDIRETDNEYILESEIPGLDKDKVKVEIKEDTLIIKGEKRSDDKKDGKYHIREIKRSSFIRSFSLPSDIVDKSSVKAKFRDGLLEVTIKKLKPVPPPKPEVKIIDIE